MRCVPSDPEDYGLVLAPPARRAIASDLPEPVAHAVIAFITGPLLARPRRIGKQLRGDLAGVWCARRGTYRVLFRIDEERHRVVVVSIAHRRDIYREVPDA